MRQQFKRPLALFLAAIMLLGLIPTTAFAVQGGAAAAAPEAITEER